MTQHLFRVLSLVLFLLLCVPAAHAAPEASNDSAYLVNEDRQLPYYEPTQLPQMIEKATKENDPVAQYTIGVMLYYGNLVDKDKDKGEKYVKMAADQGYAPAQAQMGYITRDREDHTLAMDWFFKAAEQKEPWASYELGAYYEEGKRIFQSFEKAFQYYEIASQGGVMNGTIKLGLFYQYGRGVPKDFRKAIANYEKVAEQGTPEFRLQVSLLLIRLFGELEGTQEASKEEMFKWRLKAAELGELPSTIKVAEMYFEGIGTERNYNESIRWYKKATELGSVPSMVKLGQIYANGLGVPINYEEAAKWYRKGAEYGDPEAAWNLAHLYENGLGVPRDEKEAKKWFYRSRALRTR